MSCKINLRLPDALHARIEKAAKRSEETLSRVMIEALERGLAGEPVESGRVIPVGVRRARVVYSCPRCDREARPAGPGLVHCPLCGWDLAIP